MADPLNDRIEELCSLIAAEQNQRKFLALVEELNRVLSAKSERFQNKKPDQHKSG